uniref:Uncharacterized protein n=1 Tax=Ditylenchus dipsaci TaxID=166011 RepID=A0A915DLN9_9BILA
MEEKPLTYCSTLKRAEPQQEAGQYGRELSQEFVLATSSIDLDEDGYYVVRVEENADLRQQQSLFRADAQEGRPTYVNKRLLNPTSSSLDPSLPQKTQQKKEGLAAQDHNYSMLSISTEVPLQKGVKRLSNNQQKLILQKSLT